MLLIVYRGNIMTGATTERNTEQSTARKVSPALLFGVTFVPIVFVWCLLRKGYSPIAMMLGLAWTIPATIFTLALIMLVNLSATQPVPKVESGPENTGAPVAGTASTSANLASVPKELGENDKEAEYLELLELAADDTEGDMFTRDEGDPRATWETALMTMGTTAKFYQDGSQHAVSDNARSKKRAYVKKIGGLQSAAFRKLRSYYGQDMKRRLWEHDVDVTVTGPGNSTLRFTGFWFASNRNIKQIFESAQTDGAALRFKRIEFRSHKLSDTTSYNLKSLPDSQLATFANGRWTAVE